MEDEFVGAALKAAEDVLGPPLYISRGAALLYQVTVDNRLEVTVDPKDPKRGQSAFQTDLCVFERVTDDVTIPRVVLEFKKRLSTHDVLTYSAKARKHKQIYPYLRYGLVISAVETIPGRFFTHNEALDFCIAAASYRRNRLHELFAQVLRKEVDASRGLEAVSFGRKSVHVFRTDVKIETGGGEIV